MVAGIVHLRSAALYGYGANLDMTTARDIIRRLRNGRPALRHGAGNRSGMNQSSSGAGPTHSELSDDIVAGVGAWIAAWAEFVLLGYLAIIGAFFASENASPGDYTCGLALSLAAIALAFMRLKSRFDGDPVDWETYLLVDDLPNLIAVIAVFAVIGLFGLFTAARVEYGGLHSAGLALFVASAGAVFLNMKRVFDNFDRRI